MKIIFLPRQLFVSRKKKRRKELIYPHLSILHPFPPLSLSINLLSNHSPIKQKKDIFSSNIFFTFPETFPNRNETNFDQLILLSPPSKEEKEKKRWEREGWTSHFRHRCLLEEGLETREDESNQKSVCTRTHGRSSWQQSFIGHWLWDIVG